jgi:hypothetical protein
MAEEMGTHLGSGEILLGRLQKESQSDARRSNLEISMIIDESEGASLNFLTTLTTRVKSSSRATHDMLVTHLGLTALPALCEHHFWLFLCECAIFKVIH